MLDYKQPKLWVTVIAVALIAATAVCFLTNPVSAKEPDEPITPPNTQETTGTEQPTEEVTTQINGVEQWIYPTLISDYCTIPEELVLEMRRNYPKQYLPNLEVDYSNVLMTCYGSFGGVYVVRIGSGIVRVGDSNKYFDTIGGVKIPSEMLLLLHAYHEGVFYRLDEAYNNGYLTSGELEILKERYKENLYEFELY